MKKILVIGGAGSLGRVVVERFLVAGNKVTIMSRDEEKHYWMRQEYRGAYNIDFILGDIRDYSKVCLAVKDADIVINCSAMKQVPISEYHPMEAVMTNIIGVSNIVRAIQEHRYPVKTVLQVSTDKACDPCSVMGMTKALGERIIIAGNKAAPHTRFICIRCGNFFTSNGSVTQLFQRQIDHGGPVTVTHKDMLRYFVSLDDVCDMILVAIKEAKPGEIYITNVKEVNILKLAKTMVGNKDIKIEIIGVRPGEKLREKLISDYEQPRCTRRGDYMVIRPCLTI